MPPHVDISNVDVLPNSLLSSSPIIESDAYENKNEHKRTDDAKLSQNLKVKLKSSDSKRVVYSKESPAIRWIGVLVWPGMLLVPILLSSPRSSIQYNVIFPPEWYEDENTSDRPSTLGLFLGILAVIVGQIGVLIYFFLHSHQILHNGIPIQVKGAPKYVWSDGLRTHLSQPEGFLVLGSYLSGTWMFRLMPSSFYSFSGEIDWVKLFCSLVLQDFVQYVMHRFEHCISVEFYRLSHKPHHLFTNPKLFDAFNGSLPDTIVMILIPLYITAWCIPCNVWTYMAFGSIYANWLTLIHSEYPLPWDKFFRKIGFGTSGDHHVHHKFFTFNFGHLFLWFDKVGGTYRSPEQFPRVFTSAA
mmetsp:Transcript_63776/g.74697  ORF Transcript_63776/g.74697 Transcript_63776/m.74697 type:complete len:357 (+) Transcript_63776:101-1171(+)|eukprot:CAMPEP_0194380574 /NCGR_PEP_ID=MMETSP0174-20130528/46006_1 /TAXON_ID=216777 /ORGANISM="Proboscia alata, Strain PI-D3" /LENGTH=356 /DNA_ID=CAMNT_0039164065 /DNA_START=77 /DNA_END=1147 /DNA_ORIENTATION=+